jgi:hypothetical protein
MKTVLAMLLAVIPLAAQQPSSPPAVLRIFREDIKEGKGAAHEKTEAAFMQAAAKANYPSHVIGLTSMTGTSQAWFLEGHTTVASIADSQAAVDNAEFEALDAADAELRAASRSMIAVYRPNLSFGAGKTNLPKMRFFSIETIRIREGQAQEFAALAKMLITAAEKSGDAQPVAAYEVVSGAPNGTYLLLQPFVSLKSMDEGEQRRQALFQALGEAGLKQYSKTVSETIANQESILFAISPQMSYVPKDWIAADPNFWTPKPVELAKTPAKAHAKKAGSK